RANTNTRFGYDREMEVCAVCGSLTLVNDLPTRFEDHLNGRQHVGYSKIRQQVQLMNESQYWKKEKFVAKEEPAAEPKLEERSKRKRSRSKDSKERKLRRHTDRKPKRSRSRSPRRHSRSERRSRSPRRSPRRDFDKTHKNRKP
ncbi:hypothetical protein MXB_3787, partial [Myxobolus squamalis]